MRFEVWYSNPSRSSNYWKFKLYDDVGELITTGTGLLFRGREVTITMPKIIRLDLQMIKGSLGSKQVQVEYEAASPSRERAYFIGKATLRPESIRLTERMYQSLSEWHRSTDGKIRCPSCDSIVPKGNAYCGQCGAPVTAETATQGPLPKSSGLAAQTIPPESHTRDLSGVESPLDDEFLDEDESLGIPARSTRGSELEVPLGPRKAASGGVIAIAVVVVLVIGAVAVFMSLGSGPGGFTGFRVSGSGCWSGAFGNVGSQSSIDGCGSRDITMQCDGVLSGVVQKNDDSGWTLTLQVLSNGKVLKSSSTSAGYGVASAAASC